MLIIVELRLMDPRRYIETVMIPQHSKSKMIEAGVEVAATEDAIKAVMRTATDSSVNGTSSSNTLKVGADRDANVWCRQVDHLVF